VSARASAWAIAQRVGDSVRKLVLWAIADTCDDNGVGFPSIALIAWKAECSERTAQRAIRDLEAQRFLVVDRDRTRKTGGQTSNCYHLTMRTLQLPLEGGDNLPPRQRDRATTVRGVSCVTPNEQQPPSEVVCVKGRGKGTTLPPDFKISDAVREWARTNGYEPYVELHFEKLVDYAKSGTKDGKPVLAIDWDAKLRSCIRDDWGRVRESAKRRNAVGQQAVNSVGKRCIRCNSSKVFGSVSGRWYCGEQACRDVAMYGEARTA
jgi:hypothetical protein